MKTYFPLTVALVAFALVLALTPVVSAQGYSGQGGQSYPYQTPGMQGMTGQPQGGWNRPYGAPQYGQQGQQYSPQYYGQGQGQGYYQNQNQGQYTSQNGQYQGSSNQAQEQRVTGRVVRTRQLELAGDENAVTAALVETSNGRVVMDLGPTDELREGNIRIQRGDQITVWGRFTNVGNSQVFVADSIRADGRTVEIDRTWALTTAMLRRELNQMSGSYTSQGNRTGQGTGQQGNTRQGGQSGYTRQGNQNNQGGYTRQEDDESQGTARQRSQGNGQSSSSQRDQRQDNNDNNDR